jgi:DNA-binding GntR family transcriptional regulator
MDREDIIQLVKDAIIRQKYKPGERIVELRLASEYGINRAKVREAMRELAHEGFVEIVPNVGVVVRELSERDISQLWDLMGALEGLAMRIATPLMPEEEIDRIEAVVVEMEEIYQDKFRLSELNYKFHDILTEASDNDRLIEIMYNVRAQTHRARLQTFYFEAQVKASLREHRQILEALRRRQAARVENIIRKHYLDSKHRLIKFLFTTL